MTDGSVFHGHASVVANVSGLRIGFDCHLGGPVFHTWRFVPEPTPPGLLDVLCISHSHQDHVDARVIAALPERPDADMIIPYDRPQLEAIVRAAGRDLYSLAPHWQSMTLGRGVTLTCIPSDRNDTDAAWLLQAPSGFSLWHGNDCFLKRETLERVRRELAPDGVRHLYVPYSWVHWYPMAVETLTEEQRWAELNRCVHESLDAMRMHIEILGADVVVPCGGNLAPMHGDDGWAASVLTPHEAGGMGPPEMQRHRYPLTIANPAAVGPEARALIDAARAERKAEAPPLVDDGHTFGIVLDARAGSAGVRARARNGAIGITDLASGDTLRFHLEPAIWNAWVVGRATFDDVLGSGGFKIWRTPERFNADLFKRLRRWL